MKTQRIGRLGSALVLGAFLATPAVAQEDEPYMQPDDSWISISGMVESVEPDEFLLDYGHGVINVEFDDGDRDADAYKLLAGDSVQVTGVVDDDLFEIRSIEASSVYVDKLDTYFYASAADEEDFVWVTTPLVVSEMRVQGTVTHVGENEFTVDTGLRSVTVDVEELAYDPLDDVGYQQIDVGDVVSVTGEVDGSFFDERELDAELLLTIHG